MLDLSNLNEEQKQAVMTTEGYIRVIASPGSGKTRALTHRYAYLLENKNCSSENILCITYTNKAANEMKERIMTLIDNKEETFENISTIHSYCDKLLRKNIDTLNGNIKSNYIIYDEYDSIKLIKKVVGKDKPSNFVEELSVMKLENPEYIKYLFGTINSFSFGQSWADEILEICKVNNGIMFDDLIYGALFLLENYDSIRENEQIKYKYVMVDEFQDTTQKTYELVKILSSYHKNLFVVGDPDQSIYEFIGAKPEILLNQFYDDFPMAKTLLMNTNYRSTNQIIELSNTLIKNNKNRYEQKNTISYDNRDGNPVVYSHYLDRGNELYNVCRIIEHLHKRLKYEYKDIFIITRNNYSFRDLKTLLTKNNIPYNNSRSTSKMNSKEEIKLILYYLTFALNQSSFALYNINEIADLGIKKDEIEKVLNVSVDPILFLQKHSNEKVDKFLASNERIKKAILSKKKKTSEIIEMIIGEYEILSEYEVDIDTGVFIEGEHIADLIQNVIHFEKINPKYSVYDFIDSMALDSSIEGSVNENGVKLLTVHGSKGLEAKNVIVFDYQNIPHNYLEIEGERRLSYVAFTRAKENLFILSATNKNPCYYKEIGKLCINVDEYFENIKVENDAYDFEKETNDLNDEKKKALEVLISGKNIFLTGEAGTGKTYLINKYLDYLKKTNKNVLICAPTGIAAANYLGGVTINKAFEISIVPSIISPNVKVNKLANIETADVIIIDEISMCRIDVFEYIMRVINKCNEYRDNKIQVILCGDFFQLPPVVTDSEKNILAKLFPNFIEGFAFESEEWTNNNFINICLKEIYRQKNSDFIIVLNNARRGIDLDNVVNYINNNCVKERIENAMEIHSRNNMVDQINKTRLNELSTKETMYQAEIVGTISGESVRVESKLFLKPGCRVMMLVNDSNLRYQNGSFGTVITCENDYIDVLTDKEKNVVRINKRTFDFLSEPVLKDDGSISQNIIGSITQIPVKLAYAITIHKSQGQTYDKVNLNPDGWECGQVYVALSRIKSLDGLYLYKDIDKDNLRTSQNVLNFYNTKVD